MVAEIEIILRLIVAAILGGIIGYERELHRKPAGLREHTLVCLGSALFTVMTFGLAGPNVDTTRMAAAIVMGIGFLGAGTIFKANDKVRGLTTAAELWVLAAIGVAAGAGMFLVAGVATLLTFLILSPGKRLEARARRRR